MIAVSRIADWRNTSRTLAICGVLLAAWSAPAGAQAPAWPGDKPGEQPAAAPAWPGDKPGSGTQASVTPPMTPMAPMSTPQMSPMPPMGAPPGGGMMGGGMGGSNARQQACGEEFARLREEVEKKGLAVKTANERKNREELCAALTVVHAAMGKWVAFVKKNTASCGIPPEAGKQLSANYANLSKARTNVCNGGAQTAAAAPRAPSLSEALGTLTPATQENTTVRRGGTLDTLTGNPIR